MNAGFSGPIARAAEDELKALMARLVLWHRTREPTEVAASEGGIMAGCPPSSLSIYVVGDVQYFGPVADFLSAIAACG